MPPYYQLQSHGAMAVEVGRWTALWPQHPTALCVGFFDSKRWGFINVKLAKVIGADSKTSRRELQYRLPVDFKSTSSSRPQQRQQERTQGLLALTRWYKTFAKITVEVPCTMLLTTAIPSCRLLEW